METGTIHGETLAVPERVRFRYRLDGFDRECGGVAALYWAAPPVVFRGRRLVIP